MKIITSAFHWLFSLLAIPFVAVYKAIKAGIVHIFKEVDRLFNIIEKDFNMATLESISEQLTALTAAIAALPVSQPVDTTSITAAINTGFANLTTEIKNNVEGVAPAPAA